MTKQQAESTGIAWSTLARQVRNGALERVAHGVYRIHGAGGTDHLELRAAWLQLDPAVMAWERGLTSGVVSHRSAAALYGIGHLPAETHEFTLPGRKQTRREDVRMHRGSVEEAGWITLRGLPVTRPQRIAADLLAGREGPGGIGQMIADALRSVFDYPGVMVSAISPYAAAYGLRRGDGLGLLRWLLDLRVILSVGCGWRRRQRASPEPAAARPRSRTVRRDRLEVTTSRLGHAPMMGWWPTARKGPGSAPRGFASRTGQTLDCLARRSLLREVRPASGESRTISEGSLAGCGLMPTTPLSDLRLSRGKWGRWLTELRLYRA